MHLVISTVFLIVWYGKTPPRTTCALGSPALRAAEEICRSCARPFALGFPPQKPPRLGSFQISQVVMGRLGIAGFWAQKVPLLP
jgi:hypothetical protein